MERYKRYKLIEVLWIFYTGIYYLLWASSLKISFPLALTTLKIIQIFTIACLVVLFPLKKMKKKAFFIMLWVVILIMTLELVNSNVEFLTTIMFILCADEIDFERLVKIDFKVKITWLNIIFILNLLGIIQNVEGYYYNGDYKMSLGFQHPNTLGAFVIIILLEWLIIQRKNKSNKFMIISVMIFFGGITWYITASKTALYIFSVIIILEIMTFVCPRIFELKIVPYLFSVMPPILLTISIILTKLYIDHAELALVLNKLLSGRLYLQSLFWKSYPVTLFGQDISGLDIVLDSGYIRCILQYGIVFTIFLCASYAILLYKLIKYKKYELSFLILFFVTYGFSETSFLRLPLNISLIGLISHKIYIKTEQNKIS